jgi:hypothetical protein
MTDLNAPQSMTDLNVDADNNSSSSAEVTEEDKSLEKAESKNTISEKSGEEGSEYDEEGDSSNESGSNKSG